MNDKHRTSSIASVVQELVDQVGWSSGNAMAFIIENQSGTGTREAESVHTEPAAAPLLHIEYTTTTYPIASFEQGVDGYSGTVDTYLDSVLTTADNSTATELIVDLVSENHILIRFDGIVGSGPGQVPSGANIESAMLGVQVTNSGDGGSLHRMLQTWDPEDSWDTRVGGIQANDVEARTIADSSTPGGGAGLSSVDVTADVQAWATGSDNYGWAILPPATDDSWRFDSSEAMNPPVLTVIYSIPGPTISVTGTPLDDFISEPGTPSEEQSYTVSGSLLTEDITITAPSNFQIATASGGTFSSSLVLTESGGTVPATDIFVRLDAASEGPSVGDIVHESAGASTQDVAVSGTTVAMGPYALDLGSSGAYVEFANPEKLGLAEFTIETWFMRTGDGVRGTTGGGGIVDVFIPLVTHGAPEGDGSNIDANWLLGINDDLDVLAADFEDMGGSPNNHPVSGTTVIANDVWYHAAATYDGTTWRLYLNGDLEIEQSEGADPRWDSVQGAALGAMLDSDGNPVAGRFDGVLDEVRIWDHARSRVEIATNANSELTGGSGLVARWGMSEASGVLVHDSIAPGSAGSIIDETGSSRVAGAPFDLVVDLTPPDVPAGLATVGGPAKVDLTWTANTEPDWAGYNVYRSETSPVTMDSPINGVTLVSTASYTDASVSIGTPYFYAVTAVDDSGNESALSGEQSATPTTPIEAENALDLGSSDAYVTFGDPAKLDLERFTIETWFMRTGAGTPGTTGSGGITDFIPIVTHGAPEDDGSNVDANWLLGISAGTNVIAADFEDMGGSPNNHPVYGRTPIVNDQWYHAAATYDGTAWRLYLNGNLEIEQSEGAAPRSDTIQKAALGAMIQSNDNVATGRFVGALDEVRIWSEARTMSEIRDTLHTSVFGAPDLVARWGMAEGDDTVVGDSIAPHADGTIMGAGASWVAGAPYDTPMVSAGNGSTVRLPSVVLLDGAATDDGLPGALITTWSQVAGPDAPSADISDPSSLVAVASFDASGPGTYTFRLTADDGTTTVFDEVTFIVEPAIASDYGLDFNGSSDYVTFGQATDTLGLDVFTLETWFKREGTGDTVSTGNGGVVAVPLITKGQGEFDGDDRDMNYFLGIDDVTHTLAVDFEDAASGGNHPLKGTTPISEGEWYHAAATYDGTNWRLYLNGELEASSTENAKPRDDSIQHAGLATAMKSLGAGVDGKFDGVLDEARVWSVARTQEQIQASMGGPLVSALGLAARWGMDEGPPATSIDSTPAPSVTGTLEGPPVFITPGTPYQTTVNLAPDEPTLFAPADTATAVSVDPSLEVDVTDPNGDDLTTTFYGRVAEAPTAEDFTIVVLPDTQFYSQSYPETYLAQTEWVAANETALNIKYVAHVGDIVQSQDGSQTEWDNALAAHMVLEEANDGVGIPYGVVPGNHDISVDGVGEKYDATFPPSRFSGEPWYGGYLEERLNKDNYQIITTNGLRLVFIGLEYDMPQYALNWAQGVIDAQTEIDPNTEFVLVTHAFLDGGGVRPTAPYNRTDGVSAEDAWQYLIEDEANCQIHLVLNGHYSGEAQRTDLNTCGEPVHQLLADYQNRTGGGDGWLRYMTFRPADNEVDVFTYSPTTNNGVGAYESDAGSEFTLAYDMSDLSGYEEIGSTITASGETASVPWPGREYATTYEWYAVASDGGIETTSPIWTFTTTDPPPPPPAFTVQRDSGDVWGDMWPADTWLDVTLNDGPTELDSFSVQTDSSGNFGPSEAVSSGFSEAVLPGYKVTVTDGGSETKTHFVSDVAVVSVDAAADTVTGTAQDGVDLWVWVHNEPSGLSATADGLGDWVAYFDTVFDLVPGTAGAVAEADSDGDQTQVDWRVPAPQFGVDPVGDQVWGGDWLPDASITVSVTAPVVAGPWFATPDEYGNFNLDLSGVHDLVAGETVLVTDVIDSKDHTVTGLALTDVDVDTETVSGTAALGSSVWVNVHNAGSEDVEAVASVDLGSGIGVWSTSALGDIAPETQGYAYQPDGDGDQTQIQWPYIPEQNFNVFVDQSMVHAYQWPVGTDVTLTVQRPDPVIEDFEDGDADGWTGHGAMDVVTTPANPNGGVYVGKTNIGATGDCNGQYLVFDAQMPDRFSVDFLGTGDTNHHSGLAFRLISDEGDIASINYHDGELRWYVGGTVHETIMAADADTWYRIELRNIDWSAHTYDIWVDGVEQYVGAAFIEPASDVNRIQAYACESTSGSDIYLDNIVSSTESGDGAVLYTHTQSSIEADWDGSQTFAQFDLPDTVGAGDVVTVSGDVAGTDVVKVHVITELALTDVDVENDTVSGTAAADSTVWVNIHGSMVEDTVVTADGTTGVWVATFSGMTDETNGYASQRDPDGDQTQVQWPEPPPPNHFAVDPVNDQVWGDGWTPNSSVLIRVENPAGTVVAGPFIDPTDGTGHFDFNLFSEPAAGFEHDVVADDVIVVTDSDPLVVVKTHEVTALELTGVVPVDDEVLGTAEPGSSVWVNVHNSVVDDTVVTADGTTGMWVATLAGMTDETQGYAYQPDGDGDQTQIQWPYIPEQNFNVFVDQSMVHAYQWPVGTDVTLTVQRPDPVIEDFEDGDADGWTGHGAMDVVTTPANPNGGVYVGKTNIGATGDCNGQYLVFDAQMPDRFSVDFLGTGDTNHHSGLAFRLISDEGDIASINYHDGELRWYVGGTVHETIMAADADTWYRIELRNIDWSAHTYDIWVDGVEQYVGAAFIEPASDVNRIQAYACESTSGSDIYLDNIVSSTESGDGAVLYTHTQSSIEAEWDDTQTYAQFDLPDTVGAGDVVTVSGDVAGTDVVKVHVITELALTDVDVENDTVSGTAAADSTVWVNIHGSMVEDTVVTADGTTGVWVATFSGMTDENERVCVSTRPGRRPDPDPMARASASESFCGGSGE